MTSWNILRAAGIGSYVMLFLSVVWGLMATTTPFGKRISKPSSTLVHQFMSTCGLVLLGVHLGFLLVDRYMPFSVTDLFVPGRFGNSRVLVLEQGRLVEDGAFDALATEGRVLPKLLA